MSAAHAASTVAPATPARSAAGAAVTDLAARLPAVGLDEVLAAAALQTRVDRKYLVPAAQFATLGDELGSACRVLTIDGRRSFGYESAYFDTPELALYRQHLQGRRRRYKVRTRTYLDTADTMFEVKLKGLRGQTVKERMAYAVGDRHHLTPAARAFLDELVGREYGVSPPELARSVTTTYTRTTLVDLDAGFRLTCDVDLVCSTDGPSGSTADTPGDHVLVESKSGAGGCLADRVLRRLGVRPVSVSKYCVGVALLHPDMSANPWNRTLRRHFGYGAAMRPVRDPLPA